MIALAQMVIREQRLRYAVAARHRGLVTNAVRVPISIVVMVWGKQARELLAEESIRLVYVQVIMFRFVM